MRTDRYFNAHELEEVDRAALICEDLVNNHYKLSSSQWLKNRYDIKTARDLAFHEQVSGPFAQVVKYEGQKTDVPLGSSRFSLYTVCLQDPAILRTVSAHQHIVLFPFLLYVLVHELVHVVRFLQFSHRYEYASEASVTLAEERKVHHLTYGILQPVAMDGLDQIFDFFEQWRLVHGQ
ncbi:MAG: hypothetical protein K9K40_08130 [Desulfotignum sp.]|nr:hypothetical protein [Desulfotignum sp.]MCF8126270.1 hypothetical protein [Desulfotignum sp.]